jgi:mono/diheme cytochrome c family protein
MKRIIIILVVIGVFSACLQQSEESSTPVESEKYQKQTEATQVETPIATEAMELFAVCEGCHGSEGAGGTGIAPAIQGNTWIQEATLEEIKKVIQEGRGYEEKRYDEYASLMPSFSGRLSEEEIDTITSYVKNLSEK